MNDAVISDIDHHGDGDSCAGAKDAVMARDDDRRVGRLIEERPRQARLIHRAQVDSQINLRLAR